MQYKCVVQMVGNLKGPIPLQVCALYDAKFPNIALGVTHMAKVHILDIWYSIGRSSPLEIASECPHSYSQNRSNYKTCRRL